MKKIITILLIPFISLFASVPLPEDIEIELEDYSVEIAPNCHDREFIKELFHSPDSITVTFVEEKEFQITETEKKVFRFIHRGIPVELKKWKNIGSDTLSKMHNKMGFKHLCIIETVCIFEISKSGCAHDVTVYDGCDFLASSANFGGVIEIGDIAQERLKGLAFSAFKKYSEKGFDKDYYSKMIEEGNVVSPVFKK